MAQHILLRLVSCVTAQVSYASCEGQYHTGTRGVARLPYQKIKHQFTPMVTRCHCTVHATNHLQLGSRKKCRHLYLDDNESKLSLCTSEDPIPLYHCLMPEPSGMVSKDTGVFDSCLICLSKLLFNCVNWPDDEASSLP